MEYLSIFNMEHASFLSKWLYSVCPLCKTITKSIYSPHPSTPTLCIYTDWTVIFLCSSVNYHERFVTLSRYLLLLSHLFIYLLIAAYGVFRMFHFFYFLCIQYVCIKIDNRKVQKNKQTDKKQQQTNKNKTK